MSPKKVLIVDDSEPDQFLAKNAIEKYDSDIEIMQAYDGKEALELLEYADEPPEVIFLDINMPVMNGHEFLFEFDKCDYNCTIIIMLTSSDQQEDKERSRAFKSVKQYFVKPLDIMDLEDLKRLRLESA